MSVCSLASSLSVAVAVGRGPVVPVAVGDGVREIHFELLMFAVQGEPVLQALATAARYILSYVVVKSGSSLAVLPVVYHVVYLHSHSLRGCRQQSVAREKQTGRPVERQNVSNNVRDTM